MKKIIEQFLNLYLLWIVGAFALAFLKPELFLWFTRGSWMSWALVLVMFGMGLTLKVEDFKALFKMPRTVTLAALVQFTIMPLSGWFIGKMLGLPPAFAVGLIIVACCPAGTASTMIAYVARANVALAVTATAVSTMLAIFMTPLLCMLLAGHLVAVDGGKMFFDMIKISLVPVSLGVFINYKFPNFVQKLGKTGPVVSIWSLVFISGGIMASAVINGREDLIKYAGPVALATSLVILLGFGVGYALTRLLRYDKTIARTIAIETGVQNAGLGAVLARNNFQALMPLVSIPAVFYAILQNVIGGVLATIWRLKPVSTEPNPESDSKTNSEPNA